ncbi:MAG: hypothetical protein U0269_26615 [Polyangiales bacterium]
MKQFPLSPSEWTLSDCWDFIFAIQRIDRASPADDVERVLRSLFTAAYFLRWELAATADARSEFVRSLVRLHRIPDPLARHDSMLHASSVTSRESEDLGCAIKRATYVDAVLSVVDTLAEFPEALPHLCEFALDWLEEPARVARSLPPHIRADGFVPDVDPLRDERLLRESGRALAEQLLSWNVLDANTTARLRNALGDAA